MADKIEETMEKLMSSIEQHITTKTVLGEPVTANGITVFPLADVSFGVAAGAFNKDNSDHGAGGIGAKVTPSALLIIQNGNTKIINIKDEDAVTKLINLVPDVLEKVTSVFGKENRTEPADL